MRSLAYVLGFFVLAASELACFLTLKQMGYSTPLAVGITFGCCVTLFMLVGCFLLARANPYSRVENRNHHSRHAATSVMRRPQHTSTFSTPNGTPYESGSFDHAATPSSAPLARAVRSDTHLRSDAFRDELQMALEEKREQFQRLLTEAAEELNRFDYNVLKTLEKNSPGSIEGVLVARKIFVALDHRVKEIDTFLVSAPITNPKKGWQLLLGDLEIHEDHQLTSVFPSPTVPPVKISEVEFHLKVLLKRISRRKSIFKGKPLLHEEEAEEAARAEAAAAAGEDYPAEELEPDGEVDSLEEEIDHQIQLLGAPEAEPKAELAAAEEPAVEAAPETEAKA